MANEGIYTDTRWIHGLSFETPSGGALPLSGTYECSVYRKGTSTAVFTFREADGTIDGSGKSVGNLVLQALPSQHQPYVPAGTYRLHLKRTDSPDNYWAAEGEMQVGNPGDPVTYIRFENATDGSTASSHITAIAGPKGDPGDSFSVRVEDYYVSTDPDMTNALQRAIDFAGNWPSAATAKRVVLQDRYTVSSTILLRPYVQLVGIGQARSGFKAATGFNAGPLLDCDSVVGTSSLQYSMLSGFGFDGSLAGGTAYALRVRGQKHGVIEQMLFYNWTGTSEAAAQFLGTCQLLSLQNVHFLNNAKHEKIAATSAGIFPTTINHSGVRWEGGSTNTGACVEIADANAISFDNTCVAQSNGNLNVFKVTGSSPKNTTHSHVWDGVYVESNGGGQATASTWNFLGVASNKVDNCHILRPRIHGVAPAGRHVRMAHTDAISIPDTFTAQDMVTDDGNNTNYNINAVNITGACALQTESYTHSVVHWTAGTDAVISRQGPVTLTPAKQSTGVYRVTYSRGFSAQIPRVECVDASGEPSIQASTYIISNTVAEVRCKNFSNVLADPTQITFTVSGKFA